MREEDFRICSREKFVQFLDTIGKGDAHEKILITDDFTEKILQSMCNATKLNSLGFSVTSLENRIQVKSNVSAVYFIQPIHVSLHKFMSDMAGRNPLYKEAYVLFSCLAAKDILEAIKSSPNLQKRIKSVQEVNMEYIVVDSQGFITGNDSALEDLFAELDDDSCIYEECIQSIASRLACVFSTLKEVPSVRYRSPRVMGSHVSIIQSSRDLIPCKLAGALRSHLIRLSQDLEFSDESTCDLIILDRSFDTISTIIHDWSYGGLAFDLLPVDGNKFYYETREDGSDKAIAQTAVLDDDDQVWVQSRDLFFHEAYEKIKVDYELLNVLKTNISKENENENKNKSRNKSKNENEYKNKNENENEEFEYLKEKLIVHLKISEFIKKRIELEGIEAIGIMEQGFIFNQNNSNLNSLQSLFASMPGMTSENKIRLLMLFYKSKKKEFDNYKWAKISGLREKDLNVVFTERYLGEEEEEEKSTSLTLGMAFDWIASMSASRRKEIPSANDDLSKNLFRYCPRIQKIIEDFLLNQLSTATFPYVDDPSLSKTNSKKNSISSNNGNHGNPNGKMDAQANKKDVPYGHEETDTGNYGEFSSLENHNTAENVGRNGKGNEQQSKEHESGRENELNVQRNVEHYVEHIVEQKVEQKNSAWNWVWPLSHPSNNLNETESDGLIQENRRLFVFIIGGMSMSEIRVAHQLSKKYHRQIIMGSTSLDSPHDFLLKFRELC